jgi:hypothetical protein
MTYQGIYCQSGAKSLSTGVVIEEEERLGAVHQHIIDAHRNQVDPDRRKVTDRL